MKKVGIILSILFLFPLVALASEVNYDIKHYYIDAKIQENGDLEVQEAIYLKGNFNGYERDILYAGSDDYSYDASDISNFTVKGKIVDEANFNIFNDNALNNFDAVTMASNGENYKYILSDIPGGYRLRMYQKASREMAVFVIKYTVKDALILHNDVAELNWNFIGWDFEDAISDLQIKVNLPQEDNSNYFRFWASSNANLAGEINKVNNASVLAETKKLEANDPITIRITFNKNLVNNSLIKKKSNRDALADILEEEQVKADEANALRSKIKRNFWLSIIIATAFYVAIIISWIYTYFKYDKERKPQFNLKYNREFIDDYNVEVVDYLMHKDITSNALSASIMNLIYKKNIKLTEIPDLKKKEYDFELITRDNLNESENKLIDFLFNKVGNNNHFTTEELKKYASGTKTCSDFVNTYSAWKMNVKQDGEKQGFFESKKVGIPIVFLIISILIVILFVSLEVESLYCYTTIVVAIAFMVYATIYTKKTEKGIEHYSRWTAFRNFLDDFGSFELKELPEIALWDRYMVYATVFGLADKVAKVMNVRIKELMLDEAAYNSIFIYNNINIGNTINNSFNQALTNAQAAVNRANASSAMSSGSGFGGGFSSGGGFGGGGGGGRGF